jgi:hypothetical protein
MNSTEFQLQLKENSPRGMLDQQIQLLFTMGKV